MITDNIYIEKVLSLHFNDLSYDFDKFRTFIYITYNKCLTADENLNHKISYAIASAFSELEKFTDVPGFILAKEFMESEELYEYIMPTMNMLQGGNTVFTKAVGNGYKPSRRMRGRVFSV